MSKVVDLRERRMRGFSRRVWREVYLAAKDARLEDLEAGGKSSPFSDLENDAYHLACRAVKEYEACPAAPLDLDESLLWLGTMCRYVKYRVLQAKRDSTTAYHPNDPAAYSADMAHVAVCLFRGDDAPDHLENLREIEPGDY